jgi:hypothetical protein
MKALGAREAENSDDLGDPSAFEQQALRRVEPLFVREVGERDAEHLEPMAERASINAKRAADAFAVSAPAPILTRMTDLTAETKSPSASATASSSSGVRIFA